MCGEGVHGVTAVAQEAATQAAAKQDEEELRRLREIDATLKEKFNFVADAKGPAASMRELVSRGGGVTAPPA
jgi:hypothetical protein